MYGQQHLLAYKTQKEAKFIYSLSLRQFIWWFLGGLASVKLITYLPKVPGIGWSGWLPHFTPLLISLIFAHAKHPTTGMNISKFIYMWWVFKRRKRTFMPK